LLDSAFQMMVERWKMLGYYKSENAAAIGIMASAMLHHRNRRQLGADIAAMPARDRDLVYAFICHVVEKDIPITDELPKPTTAPDVLRAAKAWWDGERFRRPLKYLPAVVLFFLPAPVGIWENERRRFFSPEVHLTSQTETKYGQKEEEASCQGRHAAAAQEVEAPDDDSHRGRDIARC
jgi:hypothetical protein